MRKQKKKSIALFFPSGWGMNKITFVVHQIPVCSAISAPHLLPDVRGEEIYIKKKREKERQRYPLLYQEL